MLFRNVLAIIVVCAVTIHGAHGIEILDPTPTTAGCGSYTEISLTDGVITSTVEGEGGGEGPCDSNVDIDIIDIGTGGGEGNYFVDEVSQTPSPVASTTPAPVVPTGYSTGPGDGFGLFDPAVSIDAEVISPDGSVDPLNVVDQAGDIIRYSITVTNVGVANLVSPQVSFLDDTIVGPVVGLILAPGETYTTFIGEYTVTSTDISTMGGGDENIENSATVTAVPALPVTVSTETPIIISTPSPVAALTPSPVAPTPGPSQASFKSTIDFNSDLLRD